MLASARAFAWEDAAVATRQRQRVPTAPAAQPRLMVPADQLRQEIEDRLLGGQELIDRPISGDEELKVAQADYYTWSEYNEALLRRSFDLAGPAEEYTSWVGMGGPGTFHLKLKYLREDVTTMMRRLRSLNERLPLFSVHPDVVSPKPAPDSSVIGDDVFVVHGHDDLTKQTVARFVTQLVGREPVILHEQADRGRTIIEKFEEHAASAACAIVLLTGDDIGGPQGGNSSPRARQNVVLELGFFLGKLGRNRVVILHGVDVELPSDLNGVLYVPLDSSGAWRNSVARELEAAGLEINLKALLH